MTEREQSHADFIAAVQGLAEPPDADFLSWAKRLPEALERLAEAVKRIENLERRLTIMDDMRGEAVTARDRQHDRANAAEAERDEMRAEVERLERELSIATDGFAASWARGPYHG